MVRRKLYPSSWDDLGVRQLLDESDGMRASVQKAESCASARAQKDPTIEACACVSAPACSRCNVRGLTCVNACTLQSDKSQAASCACVASDECTRVSAHHRALSSISGGARCSPPPPFPPGPPN
mmetsp:Transcript_25741/g.56437  ORF Transcript_25741/g.56437 Transcript_25741/m.56437 type:complete len:124 (-) Transcript_25741:5-376(-)